MKPDKIYGALLLVLSALSCNEYDPVFDKSASERTHTLFGECSAALMQAESGWDMHYYINSESRGYHLLMDFTSTSSVTIAGKNALTDNEYLESASHYEFNISNGPVISFDTYNDVLHPFADPDLQDLGGDFEFIIVDVSDSSINLRGKRNNTAIRMNKIEGAISHVEYFDEISEMTRILFSSGAPDYSLVINGSPTVHNFTNGSGSVFTVSTAADTTILMPFIVTTDGFRLYKAEELSGSGAQTFRLNNDNSALVSTEAPHVMLTGPADVASFFSGTTVNWVLDPSSLSPDVQLLYDEIINSVKFRYNGSTDIYLALAGIPSEDYFSLRLGFIYNRNVVVADVYFDFAINGTNGVSFDYTHTGNSAGSALITSISGYSELAELISSSFNLSTQYPVSIYDLIFTKVTASGTWFSTKRN